MRVGAPDEASNELNFAMVVPPCGLLVGFVPAVAKLHTPLVPETCVVTQPVPLSKPFEKSVAGPPPQDAVKLMPVTFAPVTDTDWLAGENVQPDLLGVTVYVPLARPEMV